MANAANGWANNFSSTNPWNDPLISGGTAQVQAPPQDDLVNDPYTTTSTTSAARMLGTAQPATPAAQGGTLAQSANASADTQAPWGGFNTMMPMQSKLTVSQGTPLQAQTVANPTALTGNSSAPTIQQGGVAVQAQGPTDYSHVGSWANQFSGPQVVTTRTQDGNQAYYTFNPQTGQYALAGVYDKDGYALNSGTRPLASLPPGATTDIVNAGGAYGRLPNGNQWRSDPSGNLVELTHVNGVNADQRANAQQISLGGGTQVADTAAGTDQILATIGQANAAALGQYQKGYTDQQVAAQAAAKQSTDASDAAYILNYMVQNNGALPPVNKPGYSGVPMSQDAFNAAATEYKTNNSAQFLNGISMAAPDTSAVDKNGLAALFAINNQAMTGVHGADQVAQQQAVAGYGMAQGGQNLLAHNTDYASKFNANLGVYNDAVGKQYEADKNATVVKLNSDIQHMSDMLAQLQQAAQQLDAKSSQAVTAQIQNLQNQISDYQKAAGEHNANISQVTQMATGILQAGGSLATAGVA